MSCFRKASSFLSSSALFAAFALFSLISSAHAVAQAPTYARPAEVSKGPQRIPEANVNEVLKGLEDQKRTPQTFLQQSAAGFAAAFHAFEGVWKREPGMRPIQEIESLRSSLGSDFVPKTREDVALIKAAYSDCVRTSALRDSVDNRGKLMGPGANSPAYQKAFPGGYAGETQLKVADSMDSAASDIGNLTSVQQLIILIEKNLDLGQFERAEKGFEVLVSSGASRNPEVSRYLAESSHLQADIKTLATLTTTPANTNVPCVQGLQNIASDQALLIQYSTLPLTSTMLRDRIQQKKEAVKQKLDALPTFGPVNIPSMTAKSTPNAGASTADAMKEIYQRLHASPELVALASDTKALGAIRSIYGDEEYAAIEAKTKGIVEAEAAQTAFMAKVSNALAEQDRQNAQQAAVEQTKANLAEEVVNDALIITKLEGKFRQTQIMGYTIEEKKRRTQLAEALRTNRSLLNRSLWSDVDRRFQQILPGLTVWEASYAKNLLAELQR